MELFEEMPRLENEMLILREMKEADAPLLDRLSSDPRVYVYLPTFLYEQKYKDPLEVIRKMKQECFLTKDSILLGIYLKTAPEELAGIAEIYAFDEQKNKASVGVRLRPEYWYRGIALQAVSLLKEYLDKDIGIRTITAHIMTHNHASARMVAKLGFEKRYSNLWEDWGREGPVLTDKYIWKNPAHPKQRKGDKQG